MSDSSRSWTPVLSPHDLDGIDQVVCYWIDNNEAIRSAMIAVLDTAE